VDIPYGYPYAPHINSEQSSHHTAKAGRSANHSAFRLLQLVNRRSEQVVVHRQ